MNIIGKHVRLRAVEERDLAEFNLWANDPEIQKLLGGWHFPTSLCDQEAWFSSFDCNSNEQRFSIETDELGLIGTAHLTSIDWKNRNAFQGMLLAKPEVRRKGYGVDTIMAMMRFAFDELGLENLSGEIIEYNKPSIKTYTEHCGWKVQGVQPEWYYRSGQRWDKILVGISSQNYRDLMESKDYWK